MPVILDMPVILITIVGNNCYPFLFPNSPWFFSPSCGAACCRPWDPHCHHWLHPCSPKAEKRFAQNMSSYLKSLAESYEHQADMIQRPRSKSMSDLEHITKSKKWAGLLQKLFSMFCQEYSSANISQKIALRFKVKHLVLTIDSYAILYCCINRDEIHKSPT